MILCPCISSKSIYAICNKQDGEPRRASISMHSTGSIKSRNMRLQYDRKGGEKLMFGKELIIGGIRAQIERLKTIVTHLESDEKWKNNGCYYYKEMQEVEKALRIIRKKDLELTNIFETCGV